MDTLGVCGEPSTATDNGVVMVKEPRLERVPEKPPDAPSLSDVSERPDGRMDR